MTLRLSTALRNYMLGGGSLRECLQGGKMKIYSGSQPATAEAAPTGTLLVTITDNSGAHTQEVRATGTISLTAGSAGSVDTATVASKNIIGAAIPYNTSLTQTAADLAAAINAYESEPKWSASASAGVVTLSGPLGLGAVGNSLTVAVTTTTLTASGSTTSGGVTSVNGLKFGASAAGAIDKLASQTWSGVAANSGTAGWYRFEGPVADSGALDSTESQYRMDGAISTSGAQLNMSSTTITAAATQTVTSFPVSLPTL